MGQPGFFDVAHRHDVLSKDGDPLMRLSEHIDFEMFRPLLLEKLAFSRDALGRGRPPHDPVLMFKILILQSLYDMSDDSAAFQIKDRLSFMRFLGLNLWDSVPDAKTIWLYRERLKDHRETLFALFNDALKDRGFFSHIHRKKPKGKAMQAHMLRANGKRSKIRSAVEHVFAAQKHRFGLCVRTIGLARARVKMGLINLAYNMKRLVFHEKKRLAMG